MTAAKGKRFDLLAMGRSSIDLYSNDIGSPFVEVQSFGAFVGGSPTNIAVGARRLGLNSALLTAVGEDPVGDFILHFLEDEGVWTQCTPRIPGTRSAAVILSIEPPDKFPLVFYRDNAPDIKLSFEHVLAAPVTECEILEVSGTGLSEEPQRSATFLAAEMAREAGAEVVLDLDFRADQWHDPRSFGLVVRSFLPLVDIAIGTEEEVLAIALQSDEQLLIEHSQISAPAIQGNLKEAILAVLSGVQVGLIVKRGSEGASVFLPDGTRQDVPGFPVEILNVLGAGDAFASGFIYGKRKGWGWHKSVRMGNACGAILVTRQGVANFMPTEEEALGFISAQGGF